MRLYLSTVFENLCQYQLLVRNPNVLKESVNNAHILLSFAYMKEEYVHYYSECKSLMMDSGAFTIMNNKKSKNSFNPMEYCKKYAEHIKKNNIDLFLELDIEGVYGFDVYKDCLHCLQDITGKDPIYVFHKWRGIDYYKELVKQKDYIALGDVSVGAGGRELYKYFPWFLNEAHKNNCKVHGLAFTSLNDLQFMNFDSVDSSSWTAGSRYASLSLFNGHNISRYDAKRTEKKELCHNEKVFLHDYCEWKKLSQYFDKEYEPIW